MFNSFGTISNFGSDNESSVSVMSSTSNVEPYSEARDADSQLGALTASYARLSTPDVIPNPVLNPVSQPIATSSIFGGDMDGSPSQQQLQAPSQPQQQAQPDPESKSEVLPQLESQQPEPTTTQPTTTSQDQPITIQVGECRFTTRPSTLSNHSIFLRNTLKREWRNHTSLSPSPSSSCTLFLDRDGDTFADILTYLRTERFPLYWTESAGFDEIRYHALLEEADFLMIEPLREFVAARMYEKCVQIRYHTTEVGKDVLETSGKVLEYEDVLGTLMAIPEFVEREVFVCPNGLEEHEDRQRVCLEECRPKTLPKTEPVMVGSTMKTKPVVPRSKMSLLELGLARRGGALMVGPPRKGVRPYSAGSRDPIDGFLDGLADQKAEDTNVSQAGFVPLRKTAREFTGITILQKEFEIDHGLLMGGESSLDPYNRDAGYYSNLSEDYETTPPPVIPRAYDLGQTY